MGEDFAPVFVCLEHHRAQARSLKRGDAAANIFEGYCYILGDTCCRMLADGIASPLYLRLTWFAWFGDDGGVEFEWIFMSVDKAGSHDD